VERLFAVALGLAAAVGIAGRVVVWLSPYGAPDSDEAVPGLMARHLLSGDVSFFFWGQGYGGPLETWLATPIVAVFGDTWTGLRLVPIALTAVTAIVIWRIGLRVASPWAAATAAAVYWTFPSFSLWESIHFHDFYVSGALLGACVLLLVLRLHEQPSRRDMALLGVVVGLGIWQDAQLAPVLAVALLWLALTRRDCLRLSPYALPGLLLGAVPILLTNVRHSWWTFEVATMEGGGSYLTRLGTYFADTLPMAFDLRAPITRHWFFGLAIGVGAYLAVGVVLVLSMWRYRRSALTLISAIVLLFPFISALDPRTNLSYIPEYIYVLFPALAVLLCSSIRTPLRGLWTLTAVWILVASTFIDLNSSGNLGASVGDLPRDFAPLIRAMNNHHVKRAYAQYWIAYRVDFETGERIIVAEGRANAIRTNSSGGAITLPDDPDLWPNRNSAYERIVAAAPHPAWILDSNVDVANPDIPTLKALHYRLDQVGPFSLYYWTPQRTTSTG
jgi:4-amino-4-deoxy-L-arabinose transferase-like glycosyltransferase